MKTRHLNCLLSFLLLAVGLALQTNAQTLTHRYSFNDAAGSQTFADSVGGASWAGTLVVGGGAPFLDGQKLQLDGFGDYGQVPASIFTNETQLTVEVWADFSSNNPAWTRVFSFGDQNNSGAKRSGIDYCHFAGGNYQNLDALSTNAQDSYANNPAGLNGETNQHITVVVDPVNNTLYYYDALQVVSTPHGNVPPLAQMNPIFDVIGRSLYDNDPTLNGAVNELRVYSGVLTPQQIALNDAAGPDLYTTTPGTLTALHFSSPVAPLVVNQSSQQLITGDFTLVSNVNLSVYGGVTFGTANSSVATIDTNGVVKAVSAGTTTITATDGALSATNTITIISVPATLTHRYSFTTDASDSVGGANGTPQGNANVSGGQLVLDGSDGTYVSLPGNLINIATNPAVTIEAWTSIGAISTWAHMWEFGNTTANMIYCAPAAEGGGFHEFGISEAFPSGGQTLSWAHGWENTVMHYTGVIDPINSTLAVYTNGVLLQAIYNATAPLTDVATNVAVIGESTFPGDPFATLSMDEFRIYSGALTPQQIAMSELSGPNSINNDPGALQSLAVVSTNYPAFTYAVAPVVTASYANLGKFNLLPNLMASAPGLVVTSSDPNIVSVNAQNMLTTHNPGDVTLTATYLGQSNSATVHVRNQATLTHRYSFTTDASDSVGGANGTLVGTAAVSGGQVQLDGGSGDYVNLPGGLLNTYRSATIDIWATIDSGQPQWSRLFEFADVGTGTQNEIYFAPAWNNPATTCFMADGVPYGGAFLSVSPPLVGLTVHLTCLLADGSLEVYTNDVLYLIATNLVAPANQAGNVGSWIGYSPYGDPGILGSVDEYRIYQGRLSPNEIKASDILGPDTPLSTTATLSAFANAGNIVLSWPLASAGFAVASKSSLSPGATWTILTNAPTLVGSQWQVIVPSSSGAQFFELVH